MRAPSAFFVRFRAITRAVSTRDKIAHVLAVWFGCGHFPKAPGTAGTVGAIPLYLLLRPHGLIAVAVAAVVVTAVGVWSSSRVCERLQLEDPQIVCIDEVAGVLITWLGAPVGWRGTLAGFVLFRVFDQLKPFPARLAERRLPSGWGVMFDDVFAGAWAAVVLLAARKVGWL
jgi:phosphatidylglycerophosphatase A